MHPLTEPGLGRCRLGGKEQRLEDSPGQMCPGCTSGGFQRRRLMELLLATPRPLAPRVRLSGVHARGPHLAPNPPLPPPGDGRRLSETSMPKLPPAQIDVSLSNKF